MVKNTVGGKKDVKLVKSIQKRDGTIVPFDLAKIVGAIHKAMLVVNEGSLEEAELVATKVFADLVRISKKYPNFVATVEGIQDSVEKELILSEYVKTSKEYILYRAKRNELRKELVVSQEIKDKIDFVGIAGAKIVPRGMFGSEKNYMSSNHDFLMTYHKLMNKEEYARARLTGLLQEIPAHPKASKINDHGILSPTFKIPIRKILEPFANNYDCR